MDSLPESGFTENGLVVDRERFDGNLMSVIYENEVSVRKVLREIIGVSPTMVRLRRAVRKIAKTNEDVLIAGESGVGKRFLAQRIHLLSSRYNHPFVQIDCSFILNRFSNGSGVDFTDFVRENLQKAGSGTLALYRLEALSHENQMHLLWCLQEAKTGKNGEVNGKVLPRFITTSELESKTAIEQSKVDAKLFYRLGHVIITVPPLRKRKQDIPYLFQYFLQNFQQNNGRENTFTGITDELYDSLMSYDWRGNVEELQNSARSLVLTTENDNITPEALPFVTETDPLKYLVGKPLPDAISQVERYLMKIALGKFEGNQTKAAQYLNISEASLRYKLKKYKISNK